MGGCLGVHWGDCSETVALNDIPIAPFSIQTLEVDTTGTSVSGTYQNGVLTLLGFDSYPNYAAVLASVRYRNPGTRSLVDGSLQFTSGQRLVNITVYDGSGGNATAFAIIKCVSQNRTGTPGLDANLPAPVVCSGAGTQSFDPITGEASCTCNPGNEGDNCEIPPCLLHGAYNYLSGTCSCYPPWTGDNCTIPCNGGGNYAADGVTCMCDAGFGGQDCILQCPGCLHGSCLQTATAVVCGTCLPGWTGANCSIPCACYSDQNGNCTLSADGLSASCACYSGWAGPDCSVTCPTCVAPPQGGGTCTPPTFAPAGLTGLLTALQFQIMNQSFYGANATLQSYYAGGLLSPGAIVMNATSGVVVASPNATLGGRCSCATGWAGADCSIACSPCVNGTCNNVTGACTCLPGFVGTRCDQQCNGNGVITYPLLNTTFTAASWDAAYGPYLGGNYTSVGGLFNTSALYGTTSLDAKGNVLMLAYCQCNPTTGVGPPFGYTGPFCNVGCPYNCGSHGACTMGGNGTALCVCDTTSPNAATTTSRLALSAGVTGIGYTSSDCSIPCKPCLNGTCSASGECACVPGFTDDACAIQCGTDAVDPLTQVYIGSRGVLDPTGAATGYGLANGTGVCMCVAGWAGPLCSSPCPYPYNSSHGICALKNASAVNPAVPGLAWSAEVVCGPGWSGLPSGAENPTSAPGRNCKTACSPCDAVGGTCTDQGQCLCGYGRLWQGPLGASTAQPTSVSIAHDPYPQLRLPSATFNATWHTCATAHPCSGNGEYLNATCTGVFVRGSSTSWTQAAPLDGGWGCTAAPGAASCLNGSAVLFAMAYATVDASTGVAVLTNPPSTFNAVGTIQGGVCLPAPGSAPGTLPISGGFCRCDNIRLGRFSFPSSSILPDGKYDLTFQGWAGSDCSIPCAPCSKNGACDPSSGACVCFPGWAGTLCQTPCEPCSSRGGTCIQDGSCLCSGSRRAVDGTYALRLTRDPMFGSPTGGTHVYTLARKPIRTYVSPAYATAAVVEDYLWEVEYECAHRPSCVSRTPDTQLPIRPNETYFRYTSPLLASNAAIDPNSAPGQLLALDTAIAALQAAVETVPYSLNTSDLCAIPGPNVGLPIQQGACLLQMQMNVWGRTLAGCGTSYDATKPWECDDNVKAQFILQAQLQIGALRAQREALSSSASASAASAAAVALTLSRWQQNSLNERQRLLNTQLRGIFNTSTLTWQVTRSGGPDYYMTWILHQLLYGVTFTTPTTTGYTGWDCSIPCAPCDSSGGTCQYDGSCECIPGRYGANCSATCACSTTALASGAGTCDRDGACVCHADAQGLSWSGTDCGSPCAPCAYGTCNVKDGTCTCSPGWTGSSCDTANVTQCQPCDAQHGTCLSDGACACDAGYTGVDCSLRCSSCVHGACQLDGSCKCSQTRDGSGSAGWALPDCSALLGPALVRANFSTDATLWRALNNSCTLPQAPVQLVRTPVADEGAAPAYAVMQSCDPTAVGPFGDSGLAWDPATGYLLLSDQRPQDNSTHAGDVAYIRAPPSFGGNRLGAYGGGLAWSMHVVQAAGPPHPQRYAPDAILLGGLPVFNLSAPAVGSLAKLGLYNWSRALFPELRVNARWTDARLADVITSYLNTPQLVLHYYAPAVSPPGTGLPVTNTTGVDASTLTCVTETCPLNYMAPLLPPAGWLHAPDGLPPGPWAWSGTGDAKFMGVVEGTPFVVPPTSSSTVAPSPSAYDNPFSGAQTQFVGGTLAALQARAALGVVPNGGVPVWTLTPGDAYPGQTWTEEPSGVVHTAPGFTQAAAERFTGSSGGNAFGVLATGPAGGAAASGTGDILATVADAVARVTASQAGTPVTAADLSWCLASLKEVLFRADYTFGAAPLRGSPLGQADVVRLDDALLAAPPGDGSLAAAETAETIAYLTYAAQYAAQYQSMVYGTIAQQLAAYAPPSPYAG